MELTDVVRDELRALEDEIKKAEDGTVQAFTVSLIARWRSGKRLLELRGDQKRLPNRVLPTLVAELGVKKSELSARANFARKFDEAQLSDIAGKFPSWRAIVKSELRKRPRVQQKSVDGESVKLRRAAKILEELDAAPLAPTDARVLEAIAERVSELLEDIKVLEDINSLTPV